MSTALSRVPFTRLLAVETRKMVDTVAGRALLIVTIVLAIIAVGSGAIWGGAELVTFAGLSNVLVFVLSLFLPIIGTIAATAEWSQRAGLMTFTLEPRRGRVVASRSLAAVGLGLGTLAAGFAATAVAHALAISCDRGVGDWSLGWPVLLGIILVMTIAVLQGVGFGFLFLNTPAAIVASFVLPTVWQIASGVSERFASWGTWFDLGRVTQPLLAGEMTSTQWQHLVVATAFWVGIPMAIGTWRVLTREVK